MGRYWLLCCLIAMTIGLFAPAWAVLPDEVLNDPKLEAQARYISKQLRCLVCQNESIDDSNAPLARDFRLIVRERLLKGENDQQIKDFFVQRYGAFILLQPRVSAQTVVLWFSPFIILLVSACLIVMRARKKHSSFLPPLNDAEKKALQRILSDKE